MTALRIMHVDDDPDVCTAVRVSLEADPKISVRSCFSGTEALTTIRHWLPDLVLLDVMMPYLDGPATLAMLQMDHRVATVPVVFLTARTQQNELDDFKSLGAVGAIPKPFDPATLAKTLRTFLVAQPSTRNFDENEYLHTRRYANELRSRASAINLCADRADELVHLRQLSRRLADAAQAVGIGGISADAAVLDDALEAERLDADIQRAVEALLARIFVVVESSKAA